MFYTFKIHLGQVRPKVFCSSANYPHPDLKMIWTVLVWISSGYLSLTPHSSSGNYCKCNLGGSSRAFFVIFEGGGGSVDLLLWGEQKQQESLLDLGSCRGRARGCSRLTSRPQSHVWPNEGQLMVQSHACMCIPSSAPEVAQGLFVFLILPW